MTLAGLANSFEGKRENSMNLKTMRFNLKSLAAISSAAAVLSLILANIGGVKAQVEDEPEVTMPSPYAEFQYSTLTATTNTINATMVPIVLSNGTTVYKNLTIPFKVTETVKGTTTTVTLTAETITEVPSPTPIIGNFIAGTYTGPGGGVKEVVTLTGPSVVSGGATEWTVATSPSATGCTWPTTGTFYVGPITGNPIYARLKKAGITSSVYYYGILGAANDCFPSNAWYQGSIVGFSQVGSSLNIVSFTNNGTQDQSTPADQITYQLIKK
jgi:hypothetical protein